jgi:RND family efflux transporter MFP subunit
MSLGLHPGRGRVSPAHRLFAFLLAAGVAVVLTACERQEGSSSNPPETILKVRIGRVESGGDASTEVPGTVEAARAADVASRVSASVEKVPVEEGRFVRAGELIVLLDGRDVAARLRAAEAALEAATAQRDRIRALLAKDAATRQEKEAAEAAYAAAEAERDAWRVQREYVQIRAPFDGWVVDKRIRPGDLAVAGQPLLSIQGTGLLRVVATVTRAQAARLEPGQAIEAVLEEGTVVAARVSVLGRAGDSASLRFLVKCDLPEGYPARAGSFARLRLPLGEGRPLAVVPKESIVERGALTGIFVVDDGRARLRWISLGESAGDKIQVRAGVQPGEEIVLEPGALVDGAPVERRP